MISTRLILAAGLLLQVVSGCVAARPPEPAPLPAPAAAAVGARAVEPSAGSCEAAIAEAREIAASLPPDSMSRHAADSYLVQANTEAGNGEFDDCLEYAHHAVIEVREHRHGY